VDDAVASVDFYLDGWRAGSIQEEPYSMVVNNLLGNHAIVAVATDSTGLSSTSAPVNIGIARVVPLVLTGAVWKYLDTGVDQGTAWRSTAFNDSEWPSGPGRFGTNDPGLSTIIRIRDSNGVAVLTSYYRHRFEAANVTAITNLAFRVLRDDGCVAYLNGTEIFRMNMPTGTVTFNTRATTGIGGTDETRYYPTNISSALLIEGQNTLAIELHQAVSTTDAGFDLGLTGLAIPPVTVPPLQIQHLPGGVVIRWPGTGFILQESGKADGPYTNRPAITSPYFLPNPAGLRFFRLFHP
jgi:hypothetical protein